MKAIRNFKYHFRSIWILGTLALFCTGTVFGEIVVPNPASPPRPPTPPLKNPHPPISRQDKTRVAFAQKAVELLLKKKLPTGLKFQGMEESLPFQNKDLICLRQRACYEKDIAFVNELVSIHLHQGAIVKIKHPHIIPWSLQKFLSRNAQNRISADKGGAKKAIASDGKTAVLDMGPVEEEFILPMKPMDVPNLLEDEYMVHMYVQFGNTYSRWYHFNIILSEDEEGHLFLRHFYTTPMSYPTIHMPPGVVC